MRKPAAGTSLLLWCVVVSFAMPPETSVYLGSLRLSPLRILLLLLFVPLAARLLRQRAERGRAVDALMLCHGLWALLALCSYAGVGQGVESGGIYLVESFGAYLVARCLIRTPEQFSSFVRALTTIVLGMLVFTLVETVTGNHLLRDLARGVLGGPPLPYIEKRLGLTRAFGSFEHPILYGIFCAGSLGLSFYGLGSSGRWTAPTVLRSVLLGVATFASVSSGALVALLLQAGLILWDRATRGVSHRWAVLFSLGMLPVALVSLLSNRSPIKVFLTYLTFSSGTAYNRLLIWDYGTAEVARHPWLGIGLGEWERPAWMLSGSMDNFWLATAVRYGLPAFLFLAGAMLWTAFRLGRLRRPTTVLAGCRQGWLVTMTGVAIAGCTVHFWNALFSLFCLLLGSGVWILDFREASPALAREPSSRSCPVPSLTVRSRRRRRHVGVGARRGVSPRNAMRLAD